MLPYPPPEAIKTKLRCKFSLPGMHYNCRAMGMFMLNGKGYCAQHYDTTWRTLYPQHGQQHDWHLHMNRYTGVPNHYETCRRCGHIRQRAGLPFSPCDGKMPEITTR